MEDVIINKVAQSSLVTFNLEDLHDKHERVSFDMFQCLFQGLILREKDFRAFIAEHDWEQYRDKNVAVFCSTDAIVPTWAYMLLANKLQPVAHYLYFGTPAEMENALFMNALTHVNPADYADQRVVVKGCGEIDVPVGAFVEITRMLTPYVKSIMYGEPCSTVPIYKKK
jgi:hypothetical protein